MDRKIEFEDAQQLAKQYPDTFYAPDEDILSRIKSGDFIKVCTLNERFWIEVTSVSEGKITARVDNELLMDELHYNDIIEIEPRHVYDILPKGTNQKKEQKPGKGKGLR